MSEQQTPYAPGSYERDPRSRDYYADTDEGIKHYDDLTPAQRKTEIDTRQRMAETAREELAKIYDSTNSTAPVAGFSNIVDESDDRLQVLGADTPSAEDVAEARYTLGIDRLADPRYGASSVDPETIAPEDDPAHYDPHS